jgi:hypothetical protein
MSASTLIAAGTALRCDRRTGHSDKTNEPWVMHIVRILVGDAGVSEVTLFGDKWKVPARGDEVSYLVEASPRGEGVNIRAIEDLGQPLPSPK